MDADARIFREISQPCKAAFVSTYPPRRCGIGEFCAQLVRSISDLPNAPSEIPVIAMDSETTRSVQYPANVEFRIQRDDRAQYREAANFLNFSDVDVVCVQHEFGIFGGKAGSHLFHLLRNLKKPVVTTMHTVLAAAGSVVGAEETDYHVATTELVELSDRIVVISNAAGEILRNGYNIDTSKVVHIPHGAPDSPLVDSEPFKQKLGFGGKCVLLTFGLLGPNKGLETAIDAFAKVAGEFPEAIYVILGATHPDIKRHEGEKYRISLEQRAERLGVGQRIVFVNQFVDDRTLLSFLQCCDVYVTPYPNREQVSSGTLTLAAATGRAIVSTPYYYAEELLADDRGVLVPIGDSEAMAAGFASLLGDAARRRALSERIYDWSRRMTWPAVAQSYTDLFQQQVMEQRTVVATTTLPLGHVPTVVLPEFKLDHLAELSDGTGLFQHATFQTPNRHEGYCTDDNARALLLAAQTESQFVQQERQELLSTYLGFVYYAQRPDGWFHNFMSYQRHWLDEIGSEDCQGRCIWALAMAATRLSNRNHKAVVDLMLQRALPIIPQLRWPRAVALAILGLAELLGDRPHAGEYRELLANLGGRLKRWYAEHGTAQWRWFEPRLTYANGKLPAAALAAGWALEDAELMNIGTESLEFLTEAVVENGLVNLVGNDGWYPKNGVKAKYSQQPIDAWAMVLAYQTAFLTTGQTQYLSRMRQAFAWFLGANVAGTPLYDFASGGCADGLDEEGINENSGAESTLAFLLALARMMETSQAANLRDRLPMERYRRMARKFGAVEAR